MSSIREKIQTGSALLKNDCMQLQKAYIDGNASWMIWLINTLHELYDYLTAGRTYQYYNVKEDCKELTADSFYEFVITFADEDVYNMVKKDVAMGRFR